MDYTAHGILQARLLEWVAYPWAFLIPQSVKNLPAMQKTWVRFLGREDPLEKEMATHSSTLAWEILVDRGAWQATVHGVTRVGHDLVTKPPPQPIPLPGDGSFPIHPLELNPGLLHCRQILQQLSYHRSHTLLLKIWCFHCHNPGSIPSQGTPESPLAWPKRINK